MAPEGSVLRGMTPIDASGPDHGAMTDDETDQQGRLPVISETTTPEEMDRIAENAELAANFLKAISHEGRLMILCHLATGEKSVTELEDLLSARQAAVSQQLTRLRLEGLVKPRREGKAIYYRLTDDRTTQIISVVYDLFCRR